MAEEEIIKRCIRWCIRCKNKTFAILRSTIKTDYPSRKLIEVWKCVKCGKLYRVEYSYSIEEIIPLDEIEPFTDRDYKRTWVDLMDMRLGEKDG